MNPLNPFGGIKTIIKELNASEEEKRRRGSLRERIHEDVINEAYTSMNAAKAHDIPLRVFDALRSMSVAEARNCLSKGDHIYCNRTVYSHHGIYDGDDHVYEYNEGVIRRVSLRSFADGDNILTLNSPVCYSPEEIIKRAQSRIGERNYDLFQNNCEHFARWCRNGRWVDVSHVATNGTNYNNNTEQEEFAPPIAMFGIPFAHPNYINGKEKFINRSNNSANTVASQNTCGNNVTSPISQIEAIYENGYLFAPSAGCLLKNHTYENQFVGAGQVICDILNHNKVINLKTPVAGYISSPMVTLKETFEENSLLYLISEESISTSNDSDYAVNDCENEYEYSLIYAGYDNGIIYSPLEATITQFNYSVGDSLRKDEVICIMQSNGEMYRVLAPYDITIDKQYFDAIHTRNNHPIRVKVYTKMYLVH